MTVPANQALEAANPQSQSSTDVDEDNNSYDRADLNLRHTKSSEKISKYDQGWRRIVRNFSPSWFSVTMGTGITSILLWFIPFHSRWLYWLSIVFFCLNVLLFSLAFLTSLLRYTLYPEIWTVMINDPNNSLFLGTIPMGFATIIEMWTFICVPKWGQWASTFAWILWMGDSVVAVMTTAFLCFSLISRSEEQSLKTITAAQLLPIAATIVAAGTGAEVAEILPNKEHALGTLVTCYALWGFATPLAMTVLVMYYQRLAVHKLPPREVVVSCFLPLGPLGFGGYTIMYIGKVALDVFPTTESFAPHSEQFAVIFYAVGWLVALIMWGFGLLWGVFAIASIYKSRPFPFSMGWWGFTFPLGVFAASTIQMGHEMPSLAFKVLGTIFAVAEILLWMVVAAGTVKGAWSGKLFSAPCLANLKQRHKDKGIRKKDNITKAV